MVNYLFSIFMMMPLLLFSAEFTATVSRNPVHTGETFQLLLTLKEASPQGSPSVAPLRNLFTINSQQQSTNTKVVNGSMSMSTTWKITLTPQLEGEVTIPSLTLNTSQGVMASNPIRLTVTHGKAEANSSTEAGETTTVATISNNRPYKNEPIFLTVKLITKTDVANVKVQKFSIDDMIVEQYEEPKIYKKIVNGVKEDHIEFSYLVTPLKAGKVKIPQISIQGEIPVRRKRPSGAFLDDEYDAFFILPDLERMQPFTLTSKEIDLDVLPPAEEVTPWLAAKSLQIEELWDNTQTLKAGEPLIRGFKITAEGVASNQLPSLSDKQGASASVKVYGDKPETGDDYKGKTVASFRKEQYTIIPQKGGMVSFPEITVDWWDSVNHKKAVARVPARTVAIAAETEVEVALAEPLVQTPSDVVTDPAPGVPVNGENTLYIFIAVLAALLLGALVWVAALQRKIRKLKTTKPKKEKLPDLNPT